MMGDGEGPVVARLRCGRKSDTTGEGRELRAAAIRIGAWE